MSDIVQELPIGARPERVFAAITVPEQITRWWANRVIAEPVEPQVGARFSIGFDNGEVMHIEITKIEVGATVHWYIRQAPHDWEGSTITWDLTPVPAGTKVMFVHHDLVVGTHGYTIEQTQVGWEYFLGSLKSYIETGTGMPYVH